MIVLASLIVTLAAASVIVGVTVLVMKQREK